MFDPMYLGCLPSADIIVCNQCAGVSDFGCTIDVVKDGKKHHDLKILISAGKCHPLEELSSEGLRLVHLFLNFFH